MGAQSSEQVKASNYKKLPCLSVNKIQNCQSWWRWSKRVLEGLEESGKGLEGTRKGPGGVSGGSRDSGVFEKSRPSQH